MSMNEHLLYISLILNFILFIGFTIERERFSKFVSSLNQIKYFRFIGNGIYFKIFKMVFLLVIISFLIVQLAGYVYTLAPVNNEYSNSIGLYLNSILIAVTGLYVIYTQDILNQSRSDQRIKYLEKRLECFYIPVKDIFEGILNNEYTVDEETFRKIGYYRYLAEEDVSSLFVQCITRGSKEQDIKKLVSCVTRDIDKCQDELNERTKKTK